MSTDRDRDAVTDRLIEAALRRSAGGLSAGSSHPCPDPEMLGAFVEHRLAPDEVGRLEAHLADCARCQEVLATLVRALPVLEPATAGRWDWASWLSSPWRWAVPATTIAALLAVWVVSRLPSTSPTEPETTVAQALPPAAGVTPEVADERGIRNEDALAVRPKGQTEVEGGDTAPSAQARASEGGEFSALHPATPSAPLSDRVQTAAESASKLETPAGAEQRQDVAALDRAARIDSKRDRPAAADETAATARMGTAAPAPPATASPAAPAAAEAAAVVAQRVEPDVARPAEAKAAPTAALPTKRAQETGRRALAPRTSEIVAADGSVRWRFGFGGLLFKSADGMTWERQETGTALDLLSGSALSASVCWLVGREGLVLVTVDGERWQRVPFPETVDLVHVEARNAGSATVTTADGRRFETADGGQTWTR